MRIKIWHKLMEVFLEPFTSIQDVWFFETEYVNRGSELLVTWKQVELSDVWVGRQAQLFYWPVTDEIYFMS